MLLSSCFILVSLLGYSSTLKTGFMYPSEISVDFQRATVLHIPEAGGGNSDLGRLQGTHVKLSLDSNPVA
jgi:hypothetical protein